jgi:hypothetical protein
LARSVSKMQDAVRLLMLINSAAETLSAPPPDDPALATAVGVLRSQVRLQKLDFWVRNPDYLADELLNEYERDADPALLGLAEDILDSEEPEIRRYPMLRYLFGAYEPLDFALSVLRQADLVVHRARGTIEHKTQHDYYLLQRGREVAIEVAATYPELGWYATRSNLVVALTEGQGGTELKDRQYLQEEYVQTAHNNRIPSIAERARVRLRQLRDASSVPPIAVASE